MAKHKAVALCRVSTSKQRLEGTSLEAQEKYIYDYARVLDAEIIRAWSLDTSSKKGVNLARKDLQEIFKFCKRNKGVKYLILDEVDRFMRSLKEYFWWKVEFERIGVYLAYVKMPELTHEDDPMTVFKEMVAVFQAEASNHERITKTRDKMQAKIAAGYYPGCTKLGYKKTDLKGLHEPDEPRWSLMQRNFKALARGELTIAEARKQLDDNWPGDDIDMERYRRLLLEPYYAGIVKMADWPVNECGLHKAMITKKEHEILVQISLSKGRKFKVNKKNPEFPFTNDVYCDHCLANNPETGEKTGKLVGYTHHNGKRLEIRKYYKRYRCRLCNKEFKLEAVHNGFSELLDSVEADPERQSAFTAALRKAWEKRQTARLAEAKRLKLHLNELEKKKHELTMALSSAMAQGEADLTESFKESLENIKDEIHQLEGEIVEAEEVESDFMEFVEFAMVFVENQRQAWWGLTPENRKRCKQILFPAKTLIKADGKVYTQDISAVYRLIAKQKAPKGASVSNMEGQLGLEPRTLCLRGRCSNQLSYWPISELG